MLGYDLPLRNNNVDNIFNTLSIASIKKYQNAISQSYDSIRFDIQYHILQPSSVPHACPALVPIT